MVGAYDGMAAIFHVIIAQKGKIDPDKTMELLKGWKNDASPRGPIMIDPDTRDIVQNEYMRRIEKVNGQLRECRVRDHTDGEGPVEGNQPPEVNQLNLPPPLGGGGRGEWEGRSHDAWKR